MKYFKTNPIIIGTLALTAGGIISRIIGFLYRIFLSNLIGAKGMGLFQLILPVLAFFIALSSGGIQIAVSRFVAESKSRAESYRVFIASLLMSLALSVITFYLVYKFSYPLSVYVIKNVHCYYLFKYATITIPLCAFHSCVTGYYLGLKKATIPSFSIIMEQIVKLVSLYFFVLIFKNNHITITPMIAVYTLIASEISGFVICLIAIIKENQHILNLGQIICTTKKIFKVSYILTTNKILLTFLQCGEAILLPIVLVRCGNSMSQALSLYGILTGMVIPVISFPGAIATSLSSMTLPSIAKAYSSGNNEKVKKACEMIIWFSLAIGIFSIGLFVFYGDFIGTKVFGEKDAVMFIKNLSWLSPFIYLSITLGAVLHGMGKTTATFVHNVIGMAIKLFFLWFIASKVGISGYLWGLLLSNIVTVFLHGYYIFKTVHFNFSPATNIIKPTVFLFISLAVGKLTKFIFSFGNNTSFLYNIIEAGISLILIVATYGILILKECKTLNYSFIEKS